MNGKELQLVKKIKALCDEYGFKMNCDDNTGTGIFGVPLYTKKPIIAYRRVVSEESTTLKTMLMTTRAALLDDSFKEMPSGEREMLQEKTYHLKVLVKILEKQAQYWRCS